MMRPPKDPLRMVKPKEEEKEDAKTKELRRKEVRL
jgi:hypothetical protein